MTALDANVGSVVIWAMASRAMTAAVELYGMDEMFTLEIGAGGTGYTRLDALAAGTEHRYRVLFGEDVVSPWARFVTAPQPGDDGSVRFAISADIGPKTELYGVLEAIPSDLDFMVSLGDWPYSDKAPLVAQTVDEFRLKHREIRAHPLVKDFLGRTSFTAIYDDHDVSCNWDGAFRDAFPDRVAAGLAVWDEFFPGRGMPRYRKWRWGRHLELFLLDTRLYRAANAAEDGPNKTLLGPKQKQWLLEGVAASDATHCIVMSSVPLDFTGSTDSWESFATERDEILDALQPDRRVVVISGDRHYFAKHEHRTGLREYVVGPLAAGVNFAGDLPPEVTTRIERRNWLEMSIQDGNAQVAVFGPDGSQLFAEDL